MLVSLNIKFNTRNMSGFWIKRFPILALLLILPHALVADVNSTSCSRCDSSSCTEPCLQKCIQKCPDNYYPTSLACETPATTKTTTKAPTTLKTPTTHTATTTTTTSATAAPTTTTIMGSSGRVNDTQHIEESTNLNRSRRQAPGETTHGDAVVEIPESTEAIQTTRLAVTTKPTTRTTTRTTTTTTTTPTTTPLPTFTCRLCSVESCILCQDDPENKPICATCKDGYSLSNDMASCSKDGLSGGAIAGIVLGAVGFIAVVGVGAFFLVRRVGCSNKAADTEHARTAHNCADESEQYEIGKLPDAPSRPTEDTSKGYDILKDTNKDDPTKPYSPLEIHDEPRYVNCEGDNIYANAPEGDASGPSASERPQEQNNPKGEPVSPDHGEPYEFIDTTRHEERQGIYANAKAILDQHKKAAETEPTQEAYYNGSNVIVDNVYENP